MNKSLWLLLAGILSAPAALAQSASEPTPREPPSNEQTGVAIDRFIGDANRAPAHVGHDMMYTRTILRAGDPQKPGDPGAVLLYNKEIVLASLLAHNATPLSSQPEQLVLYVERGVARIDDGKQYWTLKPGTAVLIPPNQPHRLTNDGDEPIEMLMLSRTLESDVAPRKDILVRNVDALALSERNGHWSNMAKYVFTGADGLNPADRIYLVYMNPMTIAGPHAHTPGQEEAWVKVTDAPAVMQLGSEIRPWPINAGFVAPPNGRTVHAAINLSDQVQAWFYFARLHPIAARPAPANAIIEEALRRATVAAQPLPELRNRSVGK